jgi:proteasome alpha subunit
MQFYASPEQIMRDRSEYARKGIARGRSVVVLSYAGGVLFVAENVSSALHKVSEIYDRIGFAGVGRYNEFENLRTVGVRTCDVRGYNYDRVDVTGKFLANAYAQLLGSLFTEGSKPLEVEVCLAQVGATPAQDELYRITYDGSVGDEPGYITMGGQPESISAVLKEGHAETLELAEALRLAVKALGSVGGENGAARQLKAEQLEVAILDRTRKGRAFRRIRNGRLEELLGETAEETPAKTPDKPADDKPADDKPAEKDSAKDTPAES